MVCPDATLPALGVAQGETLVPLQLVRDLAVPIDLVAQNLHHTFSKPYRSILELSPYRVGDTEHKATKGAIAIVGSGPSIHRTVKDMQADAILACNAAHEFLIERGIVPTFSMLWDPSPVLASMVTPHKDVTYLVASRCHPDVFKRLEGFKVFVWHAGGEDEMLMPYLEMKEVSEPIVYGGSAATVRAMFLVLLLGYSRIKLFGSDSSFEGEVTHFRASAVPEKPIRVFCNHRWFDTTAWMAAQAEEVLPLFPLVEPLASIEVYGDGLIPHIAETLGYRVHRH